MQHPRPRPPTIPLGRATFLAAGLFVSGLMSGALAGRAAVARVQDPYARVDLFARVLATVEDDYVEPVPAEELVDAAIRGMLKKLDSQSRWLDPNQLRSLRDDAEGTTTGLGIELEPAIDGVAVVRVAPGSQAAEDGLRPGDRILQVDGAPVTAEALPHLQETLAGDLGQVAELTVARAGWDSPRTIRTARERVARKVVYGALLDHVVYVRVEHFQQGTATSLQSTVQDLASEVGGLPSLRGLVVDLRDNPGGLLSEAVAVSDLFLDDGTIVSTRARAEGSAAETHEATPGGFPPTLHTVLLVNGMSASASEIVAGALQDTKRATVVGEPTYGKGTVQKVYVVHGREGAAPEAEAALKLTVGRYYTPSGAPVAPREGRVPDHHVAAAALPGPLAELQDRIRDLPLSELERGELSALLERLEEPPRRGAIPWHLPAEQRLEGDPQLTFALSLFSPR